MYEVTSRGLSLVYWRCWRFSASIIIGAGGFVGGSWSSQAGRAKQEEYQRKYHPAHNNHRQSQIAPCWRTGSWQFLKALCVCAVGLRLPQQVDEPPHRMLMRADAFTGVKSSFCHQRSRRTESHGV